MEFESGGYNFRIDKLNAFDQLHLSRKIAPLLPALAPVFVKYVEMGDGGLLGSRILEIAELAEPFTVALASMKNEDAEQVMTMALASVKVQTDAARNVWIPLWVPQGRMASVVELNDLGKLLPVVIKVITFNLGNFIDGLLTRRGEASPESSGAPSLARKIG